MSALTALAEPQVTASGTVSALAAITGVEDQVGDLIMPGAFAGTLRRLRPKIVDAHDWRTPVGRVTDIVELRPGDRRLPQSTPDGQAWPREAVALLVRCVFNLVTAAGRTVAANAQFYAGDQAFSIGYRVRSGGSKMRGGVRHITDLDVYEVSLVLAGAHPWARTLPPEIKAHSGALETKAMPLAARRRVPLGELDALRHERLRRGVARWERKAAEDEPPETWAELVETTRATRWRPTACCTGSSRARAADKGLRVPPRVPLPPAATARCDGCRRAHR